MITKAWTRTEDLRGRPCCICAHCHVRLVDVPEVGWVDPERGGSYDVCPLDPWGNHAPDVTQVLPFHPTID